MNYYKGNQPLGANQQHQPSELITPTSTSSSLSASPLSTSTSSSSIGGGTSFPINLVSTTPNDHHNKYLQNDENTIHQSRTPNGKVAMKKANNNNTVKSACKTTSAVATVVNSSHKRSFTESAILNFGGKLSPKQHAQHQQHQFDQDEEDDNQQQRDEDDEEDETLELKSQQLKSINNQRLIIENDNEQPIDLSFKRVKTELSTSMY